MKVLDRYIAKTYLATFFVVLLFILGIHGVLSVFSILDKVFEAKEALAARGMGTLGFAARLYLYSLPFVLLRLFPIVTFVAATIAFIRLSRGNEIQPMISSGRSPDRIALPIYVFAGLLSISMLAAQEWLVPKLAGERIRLGWIAEGDVDGEVDDIPPMVDSTGNTWSIEFYYPLTRTIENVEVIRFRTRAPGAKTSEHRGTLAARSATWRDHGAGGPGWYPEGGLLLPVDDPEDSELPEERRRDLGRLVELSPDEPLRTSLRPVEIDLELARKAREAGRMLSISEAVSMVRQFPDLPRQRVALHALITWPLGCLLLVLLGLPFIFRLGERSLFVGVGAALLLCAAYFAVDLMCQDLGSRLVLLPTLAAWLPVAFFLSFTFAVRAAFR